MKKTEVKPIGTITCPDPECRKKHGLTWWVGVHSRKLGVFCDMKPVVTNIKGNIVCRNHIAFIEVTPPACFVPADNIPTYYTPAATKAAQEKNNLQFTMMNVQPGQVVERSVELARGPDVETIKKCIDASIAAYQKLEAQAIQINAEMIMVKDKIKKLGAELSVAQNGTFKLESNHKE